MFYVNLIINEVAVYMQNFQKLAESNGSSVNAISTIDFPMPNDRTHA